MSRDDDASSVGVLTQSVGSIVNLWPMRKLLGEGRVGSEDSVYTNVIGREFIIAST